MRDDVLRAVRGALDERQRRAAQSVRRRQPQGFVSVLRGGEQSGRKRDSGKKRYIKKQETKRRARSTRSRSERTDGSASNEQGTARVLFVFFFFFWKTRENRAASSACASEIKAKRSVKREASALFVRFYSRVPFSSVFRVERCALRERMSFFSPFLHCWSTHAKEPFHIKRVITHTIRFDGRRTTTSCACKTSRDR